MPPRRAIGSACRWALGLALLLSGCGAPQPICEGDACRATVQVTTEVFPVGYTNRLDVLFVVDDSAAGPLQGPLAAYLPQFMAPLEHLSRPADLHVGVITADRGAGRFTPPSCARPGGDEGGLQNQPVGETCGAAWLADPEERFLRLAGCWGGGFEAANFTGTLGDAFGCYAAVPATGCGYVQPLAALRAALEGCASPGGCAQAGNEGFLRPDAYLLVVIITSQDDCSVPGDSPLFDPTQTAPGSELGPPTPYRCFEFGTLCGNADPGRAPGARSGCVPGTKDPRYQLTPVEEFAAFLKALKPYDPRMVYVSVIAGPPAPVAVASDADGNPALQPSCTGSMAQATPGIRLLHFISQFDDDRASYVSICGGDLKQGLSGFFSELAVMPGAMCLREPPSDLEPDVDGLQPDAVVEECRFIHYDPWIEECQIVPPCDPVVCEPGTDWDCAWRRHDIPAGAPGCWYLWRDEDACPVRDWWANADEQHWVGSGYRFKVDHGGSATCIERAPPAGTYVWLQYVSCAADPAEGFYDCSPGCAPLWPRCCPTPARGCFP